MDVREKLVGLLCKVQDYGTKSTCEEWSVTVECKDNETIADHLIAHGVTVQEWISVKDRLPEDLEENKGKKVINCIVEHDPYGKGKTTAQFRQRKYDKYSDKWYWSKIGGCTIIRWTMMPQPQKGE